MRASQRCGTSRSLLARVSNNAAPGASMATITALTVHDIRFPTSRSLDGSDAMNTAPDYSAAYVVLDTDDSRGLAGHGLTFTCGRGNEVVVTAVQSLAPRLKGM